jgi:hypothetical protein
MVTTRLGVSRAAFRTLDSLLADVVARAEATARTDAVVASYAAEDARRFEA